MKRVAENYQHFLLGEEEVLDLGYFFKLNQQTVPLELQKIVEFSCANSFNKVVSTVGKSGLMAYYSVDQNNSDIIIYTYSFELSPETVLCYEVEVFGENEVFEFLTNESLKREFYCSADFRGDVGSQENSLRCRIIKAVKKTVLKDFAFNFYREIKIPKDSTASTAYYGEKLSFVFSYIDDFVEVGFSTNTAHFVNSVQISSPLKDLGESKFSFKRMLNKRMGQLLDVARMSKLMWKTETHFLINIPKKDECFFKKASKEYTLFEKNARAYFKALIF